MNNPENLPAVVDQAPTSPVAGSSEQMLSLIERAARDPSVDVAKMERLLDMAEKIRARQAEAEYDASMNRAQSEMLPVATDSHNPQTHSQYASYTAIDRALRPIYSAHGFSLSFGTKTPAPERVTITCRISHRAGHTERVEIDMPADGKGARGNDVMTKTHATGSAVSYGMRYLLKMIFNVAIGADDDDGNAAGGAPAGQRAKSSNTREEGRAARAAAEEQPKPAEPKMSAKDKLKAFNAWMDNCKESFLKKLVPCAEVAWQHFVTAGFILDTEKLEDATATALFPSCDVDKTAEQNKAGMVADVNTHKAAIQDLDPDAQFAESPTKPQPPTQGKASGVQVPRDKDAGRMPDEEERKIPKDAQRMKITIKNVAEKSGTGKKGPWTRFGICSTKDEWFNTFSETLGDMAIGLKGEKVTVVYTEDSYGFTLHDIEV